MRKHFVIFYSPGTFFCEETSKPIDLWDTKKAVELSKDVTERYNAKPFGFRFSTVLMADPIADGEGGTLEVSQKEIDRSSMYYLGGTLRFLHGVDKDGEERILYSNMDGNSIPIVIDNRNSWRYTGEFSEDDCIVDDIGGIIRLGNDPDLVQYRKNHLDKKKQGVNP